PIDGYDQVDNLSKYLRYLRNGISHFNIEFISDNGIISGIKIWNKPQGSKVNWKIKLKIEEIKSITNKINELIHNI
ncbi:MAG: HEPN family nuclease, partial [Candidatus Gracilibacteria bacterium]|nr:HEPN family nuclease [Candidatus Gracilibacteria bacterium]